MASAATLLSFKGLDLSTAAAAATIPSFKGLDLSTDPALR